MVYMPLLRLTMSKIMLNAPLKKRSAYFAPFIIPICQHCQWHRRERVLLNGIACQDISHMKRNSTNKAEDLQSNISSSTRQDVKSDTIIHRVTKSLSSLARIVFRKTLLRISGKSIYESCADQVDYQSFFKVCGLPDTFQSWFLILQLHVWMCYVRLKADGKEGQIVNKQMAACMWEDVRERMKVLGVEDPSVIKKSFNELAEQFYGITIAYNKGYLAEDETTMLNAFRKNLFGNDETADKRNIDALLRYVEAQLMSMDEINSEELLTKGQIKWLPITDFLRISEA